MSANEHFQSLNLCVLTVSDTRTLANDDSGDYLCSVISAAGHHVKERLLVPDNRYRLRATVANWIADESIHGILTTGGTGFTGRD